MAITETNADELRSTIEGSMDHRGNPSVRLSSGGWKSARLIICVEMAESFAYFGISSNLITYLTGPLRQSTAVAAANVNAWTGTVSFLPLFWAFVVVKFLGRFRTIIISSSLYILKGLGLLSLSVMILSHCEAPNQLASCASQLQVTLFFCALYLVALGHGGYKPCINIFGGDQFDENDTEEEKARSSFFNWLMFGNSVSVVMTGVVSNYIQENKTASARVGRVFLEAIKNRKVTDSDETSVLLDHQSSKQLKFLDRAAISCDSVEIEEAKAVLRLVPIGMTSLVYAIVSAQSTTFFTKQGDKMDRSISRGLVVPAASLQIFISLTKVIFIPIYDGLLVPMARSFTQCPSGITMLQRIGTGIFISILAMVVAALVETKRLQTDLTTPMSVWWLVPQYVIYGVADVFTLVGLQELFYDQVPNELRSISMALKLSISGLGYFLSSFMVWVIDKLTSYSGQTSWFEFDSDLNQAHLDYFYWLLVCLSSIGLASYFWFSKSYVYNNQNTREDI